MAGLEWYECVCAGGGGGGGRSVHVFWAWLRIWKEKRRTMKMRSRCLEGTTIPTIPEWLSVETATVCEIFYTRPCQPTLLFSLFPGVEIKLCLYPGKWKNNVFHCMRATLWKALTSSSFVLCNNCTNKLLPPLTFFFTFTFYFHGHIIGTTFTCRA